MTPSNLDDFPSHLVRHCHLWNSARWTAVCMLLLCECSRSLHVSVALPVVTLGYNAIRRIWPDYGKYLSPEILYIPYKWFAPQTPLKTKIIRKIPGEKIQAKAIQVARILVEFKEKFPARWVLHDMQITSEPLCSDPCARFKIQIPIQSISLGCPRIVRQCDPISLQINIFGIHLEPGCKSHGQIIYYLTAKKESQNKQQFYNKGDYYSV